MQPPGLRPLLGAIDRMKPRILAVWVSWVVFNALNAFAGAVDWPQLQGTQVATGLQSPTHIANAGDGSGRLFVTEQPGRIRIVTNGLLSADAFLDIMSEVDSDGIEQGLLCVAFSPGYATMGSST